MPKKKKIYRAAAPVRPAPNGNETVRIGWLDLARGAMAATGLDEFLDGMKRAQGAPLSAEAAALVACSAEMTGVSLSRLDRMLEGGAAREEHGLGGSSAKSLYRAVERLGRCSDEIVAFLGESLKARFGVAMGTVMVDWTSMYFEAPARGIVRFGYSRDRRPDRPQVTVGVAMDAASGMPVGLTVNPGNTVDATHFADTFARIRPLLREGAVAVFDSGAYSMENARVLDEAGFGFVTRAKLNASDAAAALDPGAPWISDGGLPRLEIDGNLGRRRYLFCD
ncbi:MAG: transposase [Candidatus Methanoplasma sp.]|jgi:hypothetical protein|nr:transposase [Candidatus Methanoplasma sp.]